MSREFIEEWVKICQIARSKVKSEHNSLEFSEQCTNCEKVSLSLLTSFHFRSCFLGDEISVADCTQYIPLQ